MGKTQFIQVTMERNTLRATTPLVSDKVAKTIIARNALYEKELSDVYKIVEKEKNYCAATFEQSKKDLIKSGIGKEESANGTSRKLCVLGKDNSRAEFGTESRSRSSSLPMSLNLRRTKLLLSRSSSLFIENNAKQNGDFRERDCTSMYGGYRPQSPLLRQRTAQTVHSPDSPTSEVHFNYLRSASFQIEDSKDDVFESQQCVFDSQSLGSSPTSSQASEHDIPEILVSEVDNQLNESAPQRKTSLTKRSYSTGDLQNVLSDSKQQSPSPCSSPLLRRTLSSGINSDSQENFTTESNNNKTKYGSLDESLFQRFNDMLPVEANIPQRPKPRPKVYTEEPFYLRKKCVIRRCLQNKTDLPLKPGSLENKEKSDPVGERPLAEILPPIALPPIYTQQGIKLKPNGKESERNKSKATGMNKRMSAKIDVNNPKLTENLNDCRYLRSQLRRTLTQ